MRYEKLVTGGLFDTPAADNEPPGISEIGVGVGVGGDTSSRVDGGLMPISKDQPKKIRANKPIATSPGFLQRGITLMLEAWREFLDNFF